MSWDVIKHPHVTEKAMNDMDFENKLQFAVDSSATKGDVVEAVEEQYDVTVEKITTQNTMDGDKKAVVRLSDDDDAQEVASRIGVF
ncbi:50S ribosomal protein L23 [Halomicrobium urmianum]|uniref:50S ribosomal protein L23 n=1 Tax=Halomicrobium urmianum TaxID=1586233 RepID=UPI001CD91C19|nr:50S ribosomal protein L23 [Halomicrobium urmianum]